MGQGKLVDTIDLLTISALYVPSIWFKCGIFLARDRLSTIARNHVEEFWRGSLRSPRGYSSSSSPRVCRTRYNSESDTIFEERVEEEKVQRQPAQTKQQQAAQNINTHQHTSASIKTIKKSINAHCNTSIRINTHPNASTHIKTTSTHINNVRNT